MKGDDIPIFRGDAARRYLASQEKTVLPRLVSPPVFICLWMLIGLLLVAGGIAWFAQVPVYVSCPAVVVDWRNQSPAVNGDIALVAFVPQESHAQVKIGQPLYVQFDAASGRFRQPVSFVATQLISPAAAQQQFTLNATAAAALTRPATIVMAGLEVLPAGAPAATYVGSVYQVEIEVGARRLVSLLPLVSQLFTEERL